MRWVSLLAVTLCLSSVARGGQGGDGPPVSKEQVQAILERNRASWNERIKDRKPRLFFTDLEAEISAWRAVKGERREALDAVLAAARRIAKAPVATYIDPEKQANPWYAKNELWQRDVGDDIATLTFASLLEKDAKYDEKLRSMVLTACRYPTWGRVGPNIDLACAHLARGIALAWSWRPDLWTEEDRELIKTTIAERVHMLMVGNYGRVAWSRSYTENHHFVALTALGLCGLAFYQDIPEAPEWLASAVAGLDNTARYGIADGSSPEGVPYWSYSLSYILQLIEGMRPVVEVEPYYDMPMLKNGISYRLHSSAPGFAGVIPWGDTVSRDFYGPHQILARLGQQYQDPMGGWLARKLPFAPQGPSDIVLWNFLWSSPDTQAVARAGLDHHLKIGDLAMMRSGWSDEDVLLSVKAGFTNRNHSHLDAGSVALSIGDEWLLGTPGYGDGRHDPDFWKADGPRWLYASNATESHSTLLIDGSNQRFDASARGTITSFVSLPGWVWTEVDLTQAYKNVAKAHRTVLFGRGEYVLIRDEVTGTRLLEVDWLLQAGAPASASGSRLTITGENGQLEISMLTPRGEFVERPFTSPRKDVAPEKLKTFSIRESGEQLRFIGFVGITRGPTTPGISARLLSDEGGVSKVQVDGPSWSDLVTIAPSVQGIELPSGTVKAKRAVLRRVDGEEVGLVASGVSELDWQGFQVRFEQSGDLELTKFGAQTWMLASVGEGSGQVTYPEGLKVHALDGEPREITVGKAVLPPGNYAISADASGVEVCLAKLRPEISREAMVKITPVKEQPPLASEVVVVREAEAFSREGKGSVAVVEKPGASEGRSLRGFGNESSRHWISWKVKVEQAGQYSVGVRYCTAATSAQADLLVNGKVITASCLKVSFPSTGGWSVGKDDWRDLILVDHEKRPVILDLEAGENEIALRNPSAALNLDQIRLVGASREKTP